MTTGETQIYPLGNTQAEHERLARQASAFAKLTEHAFRAAGVGPGQRVLELGSGAGDVAMLAAQTVGPAGRVMGVERDRNSIEWARTRVERAGLGNVTFTQADVADIPADTPYDAAVGRWILMFVPDPVAVVRSLVRLIKPGGVFVFLEPSWKTLFAISDELPLWSKGLAAVHEILVRSGANSNMGVDLHRVFLAAGLPAPQMEIDTILGSGPQLTCWVSEMLQTMVPQARRVGVSLDDLGDLTTLADRHQAEVKASGAVVARIPLVRAWCKR